MILLTFFLGNSFIFRLFTWADCTDEISIFRCDSDKNSLAIIYICFKMHSLKYVGIVILFYSILFIWPRCGYLMSSLPLPPVSVDHSNLLIASAAPPLFLTPGPERYHEVQRGAAHVCMVRLAISGGHPHQIFS